MLINFLMQIQVTGEEGQAMAEELVQEEKTMPIIDLITQGGVGGMLVMLTLFILSIIAVYIFIERFIAIRKGAREDADFMNRIKDSIRQGNLKEAANICQQTDYPVARMIEKGVSRIGKPLSDIDTAIENTGKLELYKLEKNLATLATISGAAPMIGFLGTVIGMILAFHEMASAGGNIDVEMLAEGIYTAMVTTVAGLIVGILAYIGYNMLVNKVEKVVFLLEARSTEFLDILHEPAH